MNTIGYEVYLAGYGWAQGVVYDGMATGSTGHAIPIQALRIPLLPAGLQYRVRVADKGWLDWVGPAEIGGSTGEGPSIEPIQLKIASRDPTLFSVRDRGYAAEAIQFQIVGDLPGELRPEVWGRVHVARQGWHNVQSGMSPDFLGTKEKSLAIEAIQLWCLLPHAASEISRVPSIQDAVTKLKTDGNFEEVRRELTTSALACEISVNHAQAVCQSTEVRGCHLGGAQFAVECAVIVEKGTELFTEGPPGCQIAWQP